MQRYTIEDKLGEGGMGVVYRARQNDLDRLVAIKYLLPDGELTEISKARFQREMDVLISLSHPNIIRVFDAGEADGKLFYVMEMLHAHDLSGIIADKGALQPGPVASVLVQILEALVYIHENGIVHRDIKPANIMLEENGRAVLMDFGLVRKVGGTMLTQQGKLLGTPRYFAPEYIRGEDGAPSIDIWALGVTAYEMLTAERPFTGTSIQELALNIVKSEPLPIERFAPAAPPPLVRVVNRMLEKDPKKRYHTAAECLDALKTAMAPTDLQRSAELSQELSPELIQKLMSRRGPHPPPRPRTTGRSPRVTGKTARATGTVARLTASRVPVLANSPPSHGYWPPLVIVCVVVLLAGVVQLTRGPAEPPAAPAMAPLAEPRVDYESPEQLVATFRTPDATIWTLDCGEGVSVSDSGPTTVHRLAVPASPVRAPEKIVLSSGARVLDQRPPPSPQDRVRGLEKALASLKVHEASTDQLWHQIRSRIPEWRAVSGMTLDVPTRREEKSSPAIAQRALKQDPTIAVLFDLHVKGIREDQFVKRHLEPVLAMAGALLLNDRVPHPVRDDLLSALYRLDLVDGLAEYMGLPAPFKVAEAMRPAVEITQTQAPADSTPPQSLAPLFVARKESPGVVVHHAGENFLSIAGGKLEAAVTQEASLVGWEQTEELKLGTAQPAGSGGRRLHFWVHGLSTQLFPYLVPRGYKNGFAIRMHGKFYGLAQVTYFQVTVRGPLAEPSYWSLYLRRFFQPSSRLYYGLTGAAAEALPR